MKYSRSAETLGLYVWGILELSREKIQPVHCFQLKYLVDMAIQQNERTVSVDLFRIEDLSDNLRLEKIRQNLTPMQELVFTSF